MTWIQRYLGSSIGKKQVVAITGLGLVGFLIAHLAGNLQIFRAFGGAQAFNEYGHKLTSTKLIYLAELGLAAIFITHIVFAIRLTLENRAARPVPYAVVKTRGKPSRRSFASQYMILSGLLVLVFAILHIWSFKLGPAEAQGYLTSYPSVIGKTPIGAEVWVRDLYRLVYEKFHSPLYVVWYVFAMAVLGAHLHHAIGSFFETFGLDHPRWTPSILVVTRVLGWLIAVGFALIPAFVVLNIGVVKP